MEDDSMEMWGKAAGGGAVAAHLVLCFVLREKRIVMAGEKL
jgi:hypothetical protein